MSASPRQSGGGTAFDEPIYPPEGPRFARAEFVSPNGPLDAEAPDSEFDVIFAGAVVGKGVVLERFPFES